MPPDQAALANLHGRLQYADKRHDEITCVATSSSFVSHSLEAKCDICGKGVWTFGQSLRSCGCCRRRFHPDCHIPVLPNDKVQTYWECSDCIRKRAGTMPGNFDSSQKAKDGLAGCGTVDIGHVRIGKDSSTALQRLVELAEDDPRLFALLKRVEAGSSYIEEESEFHARISELESVVRSERIPTLAGPVSPSSLEYSTPTIPHRRRDQKQVQTLPERRFVVCSEHEHLESVFPPGTIFKRDNVESNLSQDLLARPNLKEPSPFRIFVPDSPDSKNSDPSRLILSEMVTLSGGYNQNQRRDREGSCRPSKREKTDSILDEPYSQKELFTGGENIPVPNNNDLIIVSSSETPGNVDTRRSKHSKDDQSTTGRLVSGGCAPDSSRQMQEEQTLKIRKLEDENSDLTRNIKSLRNTVHDLRSKHDREARKWSHERSGLIQEVQKSRKHGTGQVLERNRMIEKLKEKVKSFERDRPTEFFGISSSNSRQSEKAKALEDTIAALSKDNLMMYKNNSNFKRQHVFDTQEVDRLQKDRVSHLREIERLQNQSRTFSTPPSTSLISQEEHASKIETTRATPLNTTKSRERDERYAKLQAANLDLKQSLREQQRQTARAEVRGEISKEIEIARSNELLRLEDERKELLLQIQGLQNRLEESIHNRQLATKLDTDTHNSDLTAKLYRSEMNVHALENENRHLQNRLDSGKYPVNYKPALLQEVEYLRLRGSKHKVLEKIERRPSMKQTHDSRPSNEEYKNQSTHFAVQSRKDRGESAHTTRLMGRARNSVLKISSDSEMSDVDDIVSEEEMNTPDVFGLGDMSQTRRVIAVEVPNGLTQTSKSTNQTSRGEKRKTSARCGPETRKSSDIKLAQKHFEQEFGLSGELKPHVMNRKLVMISAVDESSRPVRRRSNVLVVGERKDLTNSNTWL